MPLAAAMGVLLLSAVLKVEAAGLPADGLRVFASRHYHIHTDLPREAVVPFGSHMDAVFDCFRQRFAEFGKADGKPMPLYLFNDRDGYERFLDARSIDGRNSGGMFFVRGETAGLATWIGGRSRSEVLAVLQHEGFHQFARRHLGPGVPVWVNEGLAQYFEEAILIDGRLTPGLVPEGKVEVVRAALEAGTAVPVGDLLTMTGGAWAAALRDDPARAEMLYAQAWSLTYFLVHAEGGRYRAAFGRYLRLVGQGRAARDAFRETFGSDDPRSMAQAWRTYAAGQQPDALSTAVTRLRFLGEALRHLHDNGEDLPGTLASLQALLTARRFTVLRRSHQFEVVRRAEDAAMFSYRRPGGREAGFELLAPSRDDLPPRIVAPGLTPEPTLVWWRDASGNLAMDVTFR